MATNLATLTSSTYKWDSNSKSRYYTITIELVSQDIGANKSSIHVLVKSAGSSSYIQETNAYFKIDGTDQWRRTSSVSQRRSNETVCDQTFDLEHDNLGSRSFAFEFGTHLGGTSGGSSTGPTVKATSTITLPSIPRQANLTAAPDFNDLGNPTITYSNPAGTAVTTLQACIYIQATSKYMASYRDISKTGTSYTFSLSDTEKNNLRNAVGASAKTVTVTFYVKTVIGTNTFYSTLNKTFTIAESAATKPTVSTVLEGVSLFREEIYIQNRSKVKVTTTSSGKYNATIAKISTTVNGKTYTGSLVTSDAISASGKLNVVTTVTDTRGFTNIVTKEIDVKAYSKPTLNAIDEESQVLCYRANSDGSANSSSTRVWLKVKVGYTDVTGNTPVLKYKIGNNGSEKSLTLSNLQYNASLTETYLVTSTYKIIVWAVDTVGEKSAELTFDIPTDKRNLHLKEGGWGVAFGKYAEIEGALESAFPIIPWAGISFGYYDTAADTEADLIKTKLDLLPSDPGLYPIPGGWAGKAWGASLGMCVDATHKFVLMMTEKGVIYVGYSKGTGSADYKVFKFTGTTV